MDRLTIVAHDRFQEIVDEANRGDSILVKGIYIGKDIPDKKSEAVLVEPQFVQRLTGAPSADGQTQQKCLFDKPEERKAAQVALEVIKDFERLPRSSDLNKPEVRQEITERVTEALKPIQAELEGMGEKIDVAQVVNTVVQQYTENTMDIPRIVVVPTGEVTSGYENFDMDISTIGSLRPVEQDILIQHLHDHERHRLRSGTAIVAEEHLEDYLVRGLIDFDDISYDEHADLLYKLCHQVVCHLQSYLIDEDDVLNVLQYYQQTLVNAIHAQMLAHYRENITSYEVTVTKGFTTLRDNNYTMAAGETPRNFRVPVDDKLMIRGMVFGGFGKCLYRLQKFDVDSERRFSVVLENDGDVLKWCKPPKQQFMIYYNADVEYVPDFAVETKTACFICEPKRASEMADSEVLAKARAAAEWCRRATEHGGGKPWHYLLIPHDKINDAMTLAGAAAQFLFTG